MKNQDLLKKTSSIFLFIFMLTIVGSFSAYAIQIPVNLGTADNFAILAKSGISTTGTTSIVGDIGVSPIDSTAITGFGLIMDSSNQFSTSSLVNGRVYASDYAAPTPSTMNTAIGDMETAYTDAAGRTLPDYTELGSGNIGGLTLAPGLYKWGTSVTIPTDITLDGNSTDVWVFQVAGTLDISSGQEVILSGGAQAKNIFWQVADTTTLGTTSVFNGNILDLTNIVVNTGATLNGRALAQTAVTLDGNSVTRPFEEGSGNVTCFYSVQQLIATCTGGTITQDTNNGCRTIVCSNGGDSMQVQACNKPTNNVVSGFEMYKQGQVGTSVSEICLGDTCISDAGFASQNLPLCLQNVSLPVTPQVNSTNQTTNQTNVTMTSGGNVNLSIMPWYPQGSNYVFVCDADFQATTYDFSFGDGQRIFDLTTNNVYHTYTQNGQFEVACTASNQTYSKVGLLRIGVGTNQTVTPIDNMSAELHIAPHFPQGQNGLDYVFECHAQGFTPDTYAWDFGDGQKLYNMPTNNVFHRFDQAGEYLVNCAASNSEFRVGASKIIAGGIPETPFVDNSTGNSTTNSTTSITSSAAVMIAPFFPQLKNYVFICDSNGTTPTSYDWFFGDNQQLRGMSGNNVWHTYDLAGNYTVECNTNDEMGMQLASGFLGVEVVD